MKLTQSLLAFFAFVTLSLTPLSAADWTTDFKAASTQTKTENKLLLMNFTGSDWCHWCHKIETEIFSKDEFAQYAAKNLVLLTLDFPSPKIKQSDELKAQNEQLAKKYGIQGFPTILILDGKGEKVGELGYIQGGPTAFIAELEKIKATL